MSKKRRRGWADGKAFGAEQRERRIRRFAGPVTRAKLLQLYQNRCGYCGKKINDSTANIDHIFPWKRGGTTRIGNLAPACKDCNKKKGNMDLISFVVAHGPVYDVRLMRKFEGQARWHRQSALIEEADQLLDWLPRPKEAQ